MRCKNTRHRSYKAAADYLRKNPDRIDTAWGEPFYTEGGSLFVYCTPTGAPGICGCLTQLKGSGIPYIVGLDNAVSAALLSELRADDRIPVYEVDITPASLGAFVEWQEKFDDAFASATPVS